MGWHPANWLQTGRPGGFLPLAPEGGGPTRASVNYDGTVNLH